MSNKSSKSRRSDYNGKQSLENESHVATRRKSVSIRELAEFARAKSTESVKSIKDDENNRCPTLSSGISIHDKIRLEALHQGILQNKLNMSCKTKLFDNAGIFKIYKILKLIKPLWVTKWEKQVKKEALKGLSNHLAWKRRLSLHHN